MSEHDERVFKQMADAYVEHQGTSLLGEHAAMRQQNVRYAMPRADKRVKELMQTGKRRSKTPYLATAAVAACLLLFVGSFAVITNIRDVVMPGSENTSVMAPSQAPETSGDAALPPTAALDELEGDSTTGRPWSELQPLDFYLPAQFSVASTKVDNGKSIYQLDNSMHDDVVLTIEQPDAQGDWSADMDAVIIDGKPIPAIVKDEYKLLQFEDGGALYTISCRDDLGTLSALYRSIVDPGNKKV
jgi:hypothetical protein